MKSEEIFPSLGHVGGVATCSAKAICERCRQPYGELKSHVFIEANCISPKRCKNCNATFGSPLGHTVVDDGDYFSLHSCIRCGEKVRNNSDVRSLDIEGYTFDRVNLSMAESLIREIDDMIQKVGVYDDKLHIFSETSELYGKYNILNGKRASLFDVIEEIYYGYQCEFVKYYLTGSKNAYDECNELYGYYNEYDGKYDLTFIDLYDSAFRRYAFRDRYEKGESDDDIENWLKCFAPLEDPEYNELLVKANGLSLSTESLGMGKV
ncbi:MAG: hypothetical protein MJ072_06270, partial [Clostridia bacterium]|nr:hypothetical protein [Clostridia bacterium]